MDENCPALSLTLDAKTDSRQIADLHVKGELIKL